MFETWSIPRPQARNRGDNEYIKLCDVWFPEGRNPWRDLFTPQVIARLSSVLSIKNEREIGMMQQRLCQLAEGYMTLIGETALTSGLKPSGLTYNDRARWLETKVLAPAKALTAALKQENWGYFSTFPEFKDTGLNSSPSFPSVHAELDRLSQWTLNLVDFLRSQTDFDDCGSRPAVSPFNDLKYALAYDLLVIYMKVPVEGTGQEHRQLGIISDKVANKQEARGDCLEFIRTAAQPILGRYDALTDQVRTAIRKYKDQLQSDA